MESTYFLTGAGGQLGSVIFRELLRADARVVGMASPAGPAPGQGCIVRGDLADDEAMTQLLHAHRPTIILHTAGFTQVQASFERPELAGRINVEATQRMVRLAAALGARLVFVSTDMVFDGTAAPYAESARPRPLSVYGWTKARAEQAVTAYDRGLVLRLPLMYGLPAVRRETTFTGQLRALCEGRPLRLFADEFRTPLELGDAARACLAAAESGLAGVLHAGGPERLSRLEMGRIAARALGKADDGIIAVGRADVPAGEPRPADLSLDSSLFLRNFGRPPGRPMAEAMEEVAAAWRARNG